MTNEQQLKQVEEMASDYTKGVDYRLLGLAMVKFCMALPKAYHVISFIMASSAVFSLGYLFLDNSPGYLSWFVVITTGLMAIIMFLGLEIWKKDYTPTYWKWVYDKSRVITTSFSVKYYGSYFLSALTTVVAVAVTSFVLNDDSKHIEGEKHHAIHNLVNQIKADTIAINTSIAEYKSANQIFINPTKGYVLNPSALPGYNQLLSDKSEAVKRGNTNIIILKQEFDTMLSSNIYKSKKNGIVVGVVYLLFEILVILCQKHAAEWCYLVDSKSKSVAEPEHKEQSQDNRTVEASQVRETPDYKDKYPQVLTLWKKGMTHKAMAKAIGKSTKTVQRVIAELRETGVIKQKVA